VTTTAKTPADLIREGRTTHALELLKDRDDTRARVEAILRLDNRRDGYINRIIDLHDDSYVVEFEGGHFATRYGTTYRVIVDGAQPESRIYAALDHAILAVIAYRGHVGADYDGSVFAARALGVDTGFE
jgi:hypothetical protein